MAPAREIRIRSATLDDAAGIAEVHVASWRWAYPGLLPQAAIDERTFAQRLANWSRVLGEHTESVLVADDGRVCGLAAYGRERDDASANPRGELYALYVEPRVARCGVGRALHDRALDALRLAGHTDAMLWVLDGNERALAFYACCGWTRSGVTMAAEFAGESRIELQLARAL
jgi:GNAT superfamily N-acetyltransferase